MSAMQKRFNAMMDRQMDLEAVLDAAQAENGRLTQRIIDLEEEVTSLKAPKPKARISYKGTDNAET